MTAQCPDILIVDVESILLSGLQLYGVCIGDIDEPRKSSNYVFVSSADETKMTECTALWRGYLSAYRLKSNGTLVLERMEYPFSDGVVADEINEILLGDFWLDLRVWFMGDAVRIPFRDGLVSLDRSTWRFSSGVPLPRQWPRQ